MNHPRSLTGAKIGHLIKAHDIASGRFEALTGYVMSIDHVETHGDSVHVANGLILAFDLKNSDPRILQQLHNLISLMESMDGSFEFPLPADSQSLGNVSDRTLENSHRKVFSREYL